MQRYAISSSRLLGGVSRLPEWVAALDAAGVEFVQIREKELPARELAEVVRACLLQCRRIRLLVNTRVDVAVATGAHGAHLPAHPPPPRLWREFVGSDFLFGVSCHTSEEVRAAATGGADLIVVAPVFPPLSKSADGATVGLDGLSQLCRSTTVPVFALGGITADNAPACLRAGAAGVAGITLFAGYSELPGEAPRNGGG